MANLFPSRRNFKMSSLVKLQYSSEIEFASKKEGRRLTLWPGLQLVHFIRIC